MRIAYKEYEIRSAEEEDSSLLCHWWNDGDIMEHAGFPNGLKTNVQEVAAKIRHQHEDKNYRLIISVHTRAIGEMGFRDKGNLTAEIGIKICEPQERNKGMGTIFLKLLISELFDKLGFEKIILDTNLKNTRAQHVYERLGFRKVGVRRDSWKNQLGELQSSVDYEMYREQFIGI